MPPVLISRRLILHTVLYNILCALTAPRMHLFNEARNIRYTYISIIHIYSMYTYTLLLLCCTVVYVYNKRT